MEAVKGDSDGVQSDDESIIEEPEAAEAGPSRGEEGGNSRGGELSDSSLRGRQISRSPPRSRNISPDSLAKMTASLSVTEIKKIVSLDLSKRRAREKEKYHSKRNTQRVGRPKGSKAKQDRRVKMDDVQY